MLNSAYNQQMIINNLIRIAKTIEDKAYAEEGSKEILKWIFNEISALKEEVSIL